MILILATVSIAMLLFLQQRLEGEVDTNLEDRASAAQVAWADLFRGQVAELSGRQVASLLSDDDSDDEDSSDDRSDRESDAAEELIQSGDTIAYALSRNGSVLANARGVPIPGLPDVTPVAAAMDGESTFTNLTIDGERVRVYTEPAAVNGQIVGAVQIAQGQGEYEAALQVIRYATFGSLMLGALGGYSSGAFSRVEINATNPGRVRKTTSVRG